jgi:NADP-dependent 3-hydroxy acid dehydrogenase YdfG
VLVTRAVLPLVASAGGDIVFVNSTAATRGVAGSSAYAASKAALRSFADSLRDEVNPDGVRVLTVLLGRTATAMQEDVHRSEGRKYQPEYLVQPGDVATMVIAALALPRRAEVTEITMRPARRPPQ